MTDAMDRPREEGRMAAVAVWGLYLLSLPSANILVIVGLIVAYAARGGATGLARQHMDAQIGLFWSVFWWTIALWVAIAVCVVTVILIPLAFLFGLALLLLTVWFTVKSVLGLIRLLDGRPA
jgi:uncharacterized membrane protein